MDAGFRFDEPSVSIPWGASVGEVLGAFAKDGLPGLKRVTAGYYTSTGRVFGGLGVQVGFHFEPETDAGQLKEIEIFDNGERELERSYALFHERLVKQLGAPTRKEAGSFSGLMPSCEWRMGTVVVRHYAIDRFGPEEHLTIRKETPRAWRSGRALLGVLVSIGVLMLYAWCAAF